MSESPFAEELARTLPYRTAAPSPYSHEARIVKNERKQAIHALATPNIALWCMIRGGEVRQGRLPLPQEVERLLQSLEWAAENPLLNMTSWR